MFLESENSANFPRADLENICYDSISIFIDQTLLKVMLANQTL